jgi:hypothetical protein
MSSGSTKWLVTELFELDFLCSLTLEEELAKDT